MIQIANRISARITKIVICLAMVVLAACSPMDDPDDPFLVRHEIKSDILPRERWFNVDRAFSVQLPASYFDNTDQTYPVLFHIVSGAETIQMTRATARELAASGQIPELIVVSLHHSARNSADLEPNSKPNGYEGRANLYLDHLQQEVFPLLASSYRISDERILSGWSSLGQFATYAFTQRTELFSGVLISSSAGELTPNFLLSNMQKTLSQNPEIPTRFYMAIGTEGNEAERRDIFDELKAILESTSPHAFRWKAKIIEGGGHSETFQSGLHDGLLFYFSE